MHRFMKKLGVVLALGCVALLFGVSGCTSSGKLQRPGWIIPK